jgi:hypothetical protein
MLEISFVYLPCTAHTYMEVSYNRVVTYNSQEEKGGISPKFSKTYHENHIGIIKGG